MPGADDGVEADLGPEAHVINPDQVEPIRIAIKNSACEADTDLAQLREASGAIIQFESIQAAHRALIKGRQLEGLRFQRPAPNDPADVDAHLVWVGEPDPMPMERGPPEEGWTFQMTAKQVGALSGALVGSYSWNPPPIVAFVSRERDLELDQFKIEVKHPKSSVGSPQSAGGNGMWIPDLEFVVRGVTDEHPYGYGGPVLKRYLAEIKHGSAAFERHQRDRMVELADDAQTEIAVLVIRVFLEGAPQTYRIRIRNLSRQRLNDVRRDKYDSSVVG